MTQNSNNKGIEIRILQKDDINTISKAFIESDSSKDIARYQGYFEELQQEKRMTWLAIVEDNIAGYVTIKWYSAYVPFQKENIPEISDLNVLPSYRHRGIGSKLLNTAEKYAHHYKHHQVGIGMGLYTDYGNAQRLYIKRGYIPDGHGITYNYKKIKAGSKVLVDDNLVLWLIKKLT